VVLMAAGSFHFFWRANSSPAGPPAGPGGANDLSKYTQARSVGEYMLAFQTQTLPRAYCLAVGAGGCVVVGGDGEIAVDVPVPWQGYPTPWRGDPNTIPDYSRKVLPAADTLATVSVPVMFAEQRADSRVLSLAFSGDDDALFVGLRGGIARYSGGQWEKFLDRPGSNIVSLVVTDDMMFAADAASRTVLCVNPDGQIVREIDGKAGESGSPGFVLPSPHWGMAMGPDGLLRIANPGKRRVEAWTVDGHREFVWGTAGPGVGQFSGCCNPVALAVLDDGRIVTAEKGELLTVTVYAPDGPQAGTAGQVQCVVAGPDCFRKEDGAVSIAVMPDGTVLVLQTPGGVLSVFEPPKKNEMAE